MSWDSYHSLARKSDTPLFIFGDHAYNFIPPELNNLGLSGDDLIRHIAWDIGSASVISSLSRHFGCPAHMGALSRLVIDMNREPDHKELIPMLSDGTPILGNLHLTPAQIASRLAYHQEYHKGLSRALDGEMERGSLIMSIHSFTDHPKTGDYRDVHIGLLVKADEASAQAAKVRLERLAPDYNVAINEPYSAYDLNYTIDRHVVPRHLRHVTFEIRQDLLKDAGQIAAMSALLVQVLAPLI